MANMVQAEVMKHHETPIVVFQFFWDVSSYVVVYFGEVLRIWLADASCQWGSDQAYRYKEARGAIMTIKCIWK